MKQMIGGGGGETELSKASAPSRPAPSSSSIHPSARPPACLPLKNWSPFFYPFLAAVDIISIDGDGWAKGECHLLDPIACFLPLHLELGNIIGVYAHLSPSHTLHTWINYIHYSRCQLAMAERAESVVSSGRRSVLYVLMQLSIRVNRPS
jgi:hypothetical protein